jgi:pimeloyl-ACP methyl ester carboxylesterase
VLLHPAVGDSRIWDPQWEAFTRRYRTLRCDLPGFGRSPLQSTRFSNAGSVERLLDALNLTQAALVGCSLGGRVALELAVARPDLVRALVLVGAALPDHEWSPEVEAFGEAEDVAVRNGDLDAAVEANLRMWVDGSRRRPEDVDPHVRLAVGRMQRQALDLQAPFWDEADEDLLAPDVGTRLGEISVETLVVVGEEDADDIHAIADRLVRELAHARVERIRDTAHVPSLERPAEFNELVLGFLAEIDQE